MCALSFLIHLFYRVCVYVSFKKVTVVCCKWDKTPLSIQPNAFWCAQRVSVRIPSDTILALLTFPHIHHWLIYSFGCKITFSFPNLELLFLCVFFSRRNLFFYIIFWSWGCEPKRCFPKMHKSNGMKRNGDERWGKTTKYGQRWLTFSLSNK